MAFPIRQGATHKVVMGPAVAVGDGFVPITNLAVSSADEAEAILHDNGTVVDISGYTFAAIATADGYYHLTLQSGISGTVGHMTVVINDDSLMLPLRGDFIVMDTLAYDFLYKDAAVAGATKAEMDTAHGLLATEAKQDIIDGIVDTVLVDTADMQPRVAAVEIDTNEIQGKLPTTKFMGSSDGADDDGTLNAITAAGPTKTEMDTAHALLATEAKQDTIDTVVDAIKAKTDNQPSGVPKNVAFSNFAFFMVDETDLKTPETGLTVTAQISKDGGAFATAANSVTEIASGFYKINYTQAEMNATVIALKFTASGAAQNSITIVTST